MDDILKKNNIDFIIENDQVLVKAKDIGDLLDIKDIRTTLRDFDKDEKMKLAIRDNKNRSQMTNMLTDKGIKRLLMITRKPKSIELCKLLNIEYNIKIVAEETNFVEQIVTAFNTFNIKEQYKCLNYRIDLYFIDYKLAIEFDEPHSYKYKLNDIKRENTIKEYLNCKFIRVKHKDNIFKTINIILLEIITQTKFNNIL